MRETRMRIRMHRPRLSSAPGSDTDQPIEKRLYLTSSCALVLGALSQTHRTAARVGGNVPCAWSPPVMGVCLTGTRRPGG
jgi:hypothetical protein